MRSILERVMMIIIMTATISLSLSIINLGLNIMMLGKWLKTWAIVFCIALPLSFLLPPFCNKLSGKIFSFFSKVS